LKAVTYAFPPGYRENAEEEEIPMYFQAWSPFQTQKKNATVTKGENTLGESKLICIEAQLMHKFVWKKHF
jgi:hypothetical protein